MPFSFPPAEGPVCANPERGIFFLNAESIALAVGRRERIPGKRSKSRALALQKNNHLRFRESRYDYGQRWP